jgi:multimeric flavodoxin WrbA
MKAVIFNGANEGDATTDAMDSALAKQLMLMGWDVESVELRGKKIAGCTGCFGCWVKTPGSCLLDDYGRETAKKVIQSDLMVFLTPITFGGYSSELKKAVDRILPTVLPYFELYRGQIHHKIRYKKRPKHLFIGVGPANETEKETFLALAERNALNFRPPAYASAVFQGDEDAATITTQIMDLLKRVEVIL